VTLKSIVSVSLLSLFEKSSVLETRRYDILKLAKSVNLGLTHHGSSSSRPAKNKVKQGGQINVHPVMQLY
jgi:hypothetical protein